MYCSYETRKVLDCIADYGIEQPHGDDVFNVECAVGRFWNTHIIKVIEDVMSRSGDLKKRVEKASEQGWTYFEKPVISLLTPRGAAQRTESVIIEPTPWGMTVYCLVARALCVSDFNMKELALLTQDIPLMFPSGDSIQVLINAIEACKRMNNRSIYYFHGVLRREYQTLQGRIREIQQQSADAEDSGWTIPATYEKMDVTERRELTADWADRLNSIQISKALNAED